jgi:carbamoyl-phosphate synthase large subunit
VNPRASRTVPYVSKATGVPLAKIAVGLMIGYKLTDFVAQPAGAKTAPARTGGTFPLPPVAEPLLPQSSGCLTVSQFFVKSPVFPFNKFPGVDPALGPEMRSTGEVMGVGLDFGEAFAKAQLSAGTPLPAKGTVFISVNDRDKAVAIEVARAFSEHGFQIAATRGTAFAIQNAGLKCRTVLKVNEGRPNAVDLMKAGQLQLAIYTATGAHSFADEKTIRRTAVLYRVPCITTIAGARAAAQAIVSRSKDPLRVWSLQEIHSGEGKEAAV